jgi:hypothetical protein
MSGRHEKPQAAGTVPNTTTAEMLSCVLTSLAISDPGVCDRLAEAESNARLN